MKLYRGVGDHIDQANGGLIRPRSQDDKAEAYAGSLDWGANSDRIPVGAASSETAKVLHNSCSSRHPSSYVSFTDQPTSAIWFALHDFGTGQLYEVESDELDIAGIEWCENFDGVRYKSEREYLVNLKGYDFLPAELIKDKKPLARH